MVVGHYGAWRMAVTSLNFLPAFLQHFNFSSKWGSGGYGVDRRCGVAEVKGVTELLGSTELGGVAELGGGPELRVRSGGGWRSRGPESRYTA